MIVAELSGQLTVERLQRALERAQQRHPLLRARIRRMGLRLAVELETPPNPIPLSVNRLPEWQDEVTRWMDTPFPVGRGPLMRCLWFCDEGPEAVFALVFSHMICDGLAAVSLTREILEDAASQEPRPVRPALELRPPIERLVPSSGAGLVARFFAKRTADWVRLGPPRRLPGFRDVVFQQRAVGFVSVQLDAERSAALASRCRAENTTVNGALAAALLFSIREEFPPARAATLALSSPVDLRSHCSPEVASDAVGNYIGHIVTVHRVTGATRFWELARAFNSELRSYVKAGHHYATWLGLPPASLPLTLGLWARLATGLLRFQPPSAMLTNVGRIGAIALGSGAQLRRLLIGLSPIYRDALALCALSVEGALTLNLTFAAKALARERCERIAAHVDETLSASLE
jgi:NRPS condensation-like uncharacterized protein